jgi:hypothetical protein
LSNIFFFYLNYSIILANIIEGPLAPLLPPGIIQSEPRSVFEREEYDAERLYLAKWATSMQEQAEDAAMLENQGQSSEFNNWKKRWSDTELKPWEEETEVGTFEVLNVCNILLQNVINPSEVF